MHAVVIHADIHDLAEAKKGLESEVIPTIKQAPGFRCAYFVALDDSHGVSVSIFDTEEHAQGSGRPPEGSSAPGVTLSKIQFGEVIGAA